MNSFCNTVFVIVMQTKLVVVVVVVVLSAETIRLMHVPFFFAHFRSLFFCSETYTKAHKTNNGKCQSKSTSRRLLVNVTIYYDSSDGDAIQVERIE